MKNLILNARKVSIDLRVEQQKRKDEKYDTFETRVHDMVKDSADTIDRLAVALMVSEETIKKLAGKLNLSEKDTNSILSIIETSDQKMLETYKKI